MRSRLVALAVLMVLTAPFAVAAPLAAPETPLAEPAPARADAENEGGVEDLAETAAAAAGMGSTPVPLPPMAAPLESPGILLPGLAVAGLALLGAAGAAAWTFLQGGARFVTRAEVLKNSVRQRIYAFLKTNVGANLKQVTDTLGLTTTNAIWHLRKLEEAGLIHSRRFNGYKVFYPAEGGIEARRLSLGKTALANENAQEVFEHVVTHPGAHQREIARALGVNHGTVRWHLKKLLHAELITEARRGKASSYQPTDAGLQALRELHADRTRQPPTGGAGALVTAA